MKRHSDGYKQSSTETRSQLKTTRHFHRWSLLIVIISLALALLACGLFNTRTRSTSGPIIIRRLPSLTPTTIPFLQAETNSEEPAVVSSGPLPSPTGTLIPAPTFTPTSADTVASGVATDPNSNGPPLLTTLVALNVRTGPGAEYAIVGQLIQGQSTEVIGRNPDGTWWQIAYPPGSASPAWVSADPQYATVNNGEAAQIVQGPVTPTSTTIVQGPAALTSTVIAQGPAAPTLTVIAQVSTAPTLTATAIATPTLPLTDTTPVVATETPITPTATVSIQQTRTPKPTNTPLPPAVKEIFQVPTSMRPSVD